MNYQQGLPDLTNSGLTLNQEFLMVTELESLLALCILAVIKVWLNFPAIRKGKILWSLKKNNLFTCVCNHTVLIPPYIKLSTSLR